MFLPAPERNLGGPALCKVAGDLGIADEISLRIANAIDDGARPKPGPILALAPAFAFESALASRRRQASGRQPRPTVLFGVKSREVLAEDLLLLIPLEAARARVPADHKNVRVEHIDGVIRHRFDQETITSVLG